MVKRPKVELSVPFSAYQELQAKYDALVHEVIQLKRDGFVLPENLPAPLQGQTLPQEVLGAIASLCMDNPDLERTLTQAAWTLLRSGLEPAVVAQRIIDGEPAEL